MSDFPDWFAKDIDESFEKLGQLVGWVLAFVVATLVAVLLQ